MRRRPFRSSAAFTIPGTSTRCRIFIAARWAESWSGRQRLDITTNWAITSSTAIITIAFANAAVPHIIFFFNLAIVWVMLWIEARRYRFYDAFRARIRMLEAHFLVPMVMENRDLLQGEWKKLVCEDLILPCFKISRLEAIGRRLKRNYVSFSFLFWWRGSLKFFYTRPAQWKACRISIARCESAISHRGWSRLCWWALLPASSASPFTSAKNLPAKFRSSGRTDLCGGSESE